MATRLYRLALRAFPARHRRLYAAEMIDVFERQLDAARHDTRRTAVARFLVMACLNAIATGLVERRRHHVVRFGYAFCALDFTLAWRMLVRYPGLSLVSILGISVGIAIAAGTFAVVSAMTDATLPLEDGERVVSLVNWDASTSNREPRLIHDFTAWRLMTSIDDVSITRTVQRNLIANGRAPEVVTAAEISASAFHLARVAPLRGRVLLPGDEAPGAPDVIVIGEGEWVRRFEADPNILGRRLQLGTTTYEVVGVMPDSFKFPLHHTYWIPWRLDVSSYQPRSGPSVNVFGRLATGATIDSAQAELTTIGERLAAGEPATHGHLRPRVLPYAFAYNDMDDPENVLMLNAIQFAIVLLLVVVCVNVAILVYARTATRQGEIAVRTALGASRRRIVAQLFVEALLLSAVAAAAGVGLAAVALRLIQGQMLMIGNQVLPFWTSLQLPAGGVLYIVMLTLLAATIIGVAPGLKATGRRVHAGLQSLSPGSGSRMQMGRLWTTLIVAQVALTVAMMPTGMFLAWTALRFRTGDAGFATQEFLTAQLIADRATAADTPDGERAFTARLAVSHRELDRRLREQSLAGDITFSLTGAGEERAMVVEVDGRDAPILPADYNIVEGTKQGHLVRFNRVAVNFFEAFDVPVIMGRNFQASDAGPAETTQSVLVNRALVDLVFGGANPLGARLRYVGRSREANARDVVLNRWYEIVGVVPDFPVLRSLDTERESRVYHAASFGDFYPIELAVRVQSQDPMAFANAFRDISANVDPNLQLRDVATLEMIMKREQGFMRLIGAMVILVMLSVILLAAAGIYALMSFTVARRRREIGIRAALGANRNRLLAGIFGRVLGQLAIGSLAGILGAVALEPLVQGEMFQGRGAVILPLVALVMMVVGLLAAVGPARQGLNIQPTEALRED